jgi:hypothetical protein
MSSHTSKLIHADEIYVPALGISSNPTILRAGKVMIVRVSFEHISQYPKHLQTRFQKIEVQKKRQQEDIYEAVIDRSELHEYKLYWVYEGNIGKVKLNESYIGTYYDWGEQYGLVIKVQ